MVTARLFHHSLGLAIPDGIVTGSRCLSRCFILVCSKCIIPACSSRLSTLHRDAEDVFLHLNKVQVQFEVSGWHNFKKVHYFCQTVVIAVALLGLRIIFLQMIMEFEVRKKGNNHSEIMSSPTMKVFAIVRGCGIIIYSAVPLQL